MIIKGDYVMLTREVMVHSTRIPEGAEGHVIDAPDASGLLTFDYGGDSLPVPVDAVRETAEPLPDDAWGW